MRLTQTHLQFWHSFRQPSWASRLERPKFEYAGRPGAPLIDLCVNAHAGLKFRLLETSNLVSLLRGHRNRAGKRNFVPDGLYPWRTLREYLLHLSMNSQSAKRRALARKWYRRIAQ